MLIIILLIPSSWKSDTNLEQPFTKFIAITKLSAILHKEEALDIQSSCYFNLYTHTSLILHSTSLNKGRCRSFTEDGLGEEEKEEEKDDDKEEEGEEKEEEEGEEKKEEEEE